MTQNGTFGFPLLGLIPRGIPTETLQTWAAIGAEAAAKQTHESIRAVIDALRFPLQAKPTTYLQGSYRNSTNIRASSDVDIVVEFPNNPLMLTNTTHELQHWYDLQETILAALRNNYGQHAVAVKKKCLRVAGSTSRLSADVVIALPHSTTFQTAVSRFDVKGIRFRIPEKHTWLINYPREHYQNGIQKNSALQTNGWFKPTVRIFKNAVNAARLEAPSYFLECLLFNVPNQLYGESYRQSFDRVLAWLRSANLSQFICQNGMSYLFGSAEEQWNLPSASHIIHRLSDFRDNYR